MGVSPKCFKSKKRRKKKERRERERKFGDNNGQATHGARKHAWRTQAAWANISTNPKTCEQETLIAWNLVMENKLLVCLRIFFAQI